MATTPKSPRATKTRKTTRTTKPAAAKTKRATATKKATAKTAASRATAKTATAKTAKKTTTKVAETKATVASAKGPLSPMERLRSLHLSSALVWLIFTGLILAFTSTAAVAVRLSHQARDTFAGGENVVLGQASSVLYNIEPKHVLALSLLLGAVGSVLLAGRLRRSYEATVANKTSGLRWLSLGLSASVLITYVNLLAGVTDEATLKLSSILILLTTLLSFLAERDNVGAARPRYLAFGLALLAGAAAWLPLLSSMLGTPLYGNERFGWYVYALAGAVLAGFTALALNQYAHLKRGAAVDYPRTEERYVKIYLYTTFAAVIISLFAFR